MEFKELLAAFAAKYGVDGLDGADGVNAAQGVDDSHHDMLSSGYFHV